MTSILAEAALRVETCIFKDISGIAIPENLNDQELGEKNIPEIETEIPVENNRVNCENNDNAGDTNINNNDIINENDDINKSDTKINNNDIINENDDNINNSDTIINNNDANINNGDNNVDDEDPNIIHSVETDDINIENNSNNNEGNNTSGVYALLRWIRKTSDDKHTINNDEITMTDDKQAEFIVQNNLEVFDEVQSLEQKELDRLRELEELERVRSLALLADVAGGVHHLAGKTPAASWLLHTTCIVGMAEGEKSAENGTTSPTEVKFSDVLAELKKVFDVDEETLQECLKNAQVVKAPEVVLRLHILEAKDLKMKSVSGSTNPYVTASLSHSSHRTRLLHQTRCPKWDQRFDMKFQDVQKEVLKLEVWHEHEHLGVGVVRDIRDLKGLGRLVKGSTAPDHLLLGGVLLPLKDIPESGLEKWYPLMKDDSNPSNSLSSSNSNLSVGGTQLSSTSSHTFNLTSQLTHLKNTGAALIHSGHSPNSTHKQRGELKISASFGCAEKSEVYSIKTYESLLVKFILHYVENVPDRAPWCGQLPPEGVCALHIMALMAGLTEHHKLLALWTAACRTSNVDCVWLSQVLQNILSTDQSEFTADQLQSLHDSLLAWMSHAEDKLCSLHSHYPAERGVTSAHQLGGLLRGLRLLSKSRLSAEFLVDRKIDVEQMVRKAVEKHTSQWWLALLERELKDSLTPDEQILRVINITDECYTFIELATSLYSPVFVNDFGLPYLRIVYLFITKKLNPCVRPLLMNVYSRLLSNHAGNKCQDTGNKNVPTDAKNHYALNAGTSLWQLYINLGRIHKQGSTMPAEVRNESGVREYHRWFSKGVMHWMQVAQTRIHGIISNAVTADQLVPCDEYCNFSSSATDAVTVFLGVRNWWLELAWPDPQNSGVLLGKILEDLCCCATYYCDLLRHKVDSIYVAQQGEGKVFITKQICIGLNNIERVRDEVAKLPEVFRVSDLLETISKGTPDSTNSEANRAAAEQFKGTFQRLISSAMENMETKLTEFVDSVVDKVSGILLAGLTDACEAHKPELLLGEVLDPGLALMREVLQDTNFRRFLLALWRCLLELIRTLVLRSAERRKPEFFQAVHDVLCSSLLFFTPLGGLEQEEAITDEYTSLLELLSTLRLSTSQLIGRYYQERAEERQLLSVTSRGDLFVNMFFTRSSKLVVEVVMSRDMQTDDDSSSQGSRNSHGKAPTSPSHVPVDPYVKVQLVPSDLFPGAVTYTTKVMKRSDPAIFQETFTYTLSAEDHSVREGYLLFTLKDHNLARSNTFIGEAVVPLAGVVVVESEAISCQPKTQQLKLTRPGIEAAYKPLATLRLRRSADHVACTFLRKIAPRFAEPHVRKESKDSNVLPVPDEDKASEKGGRSPKIFDRLFASAVKHDS
ncbi:protein unc-13 homolog 4B [Hyalella azteca]|uniref:Protein unc-13 homolog 4B n=1 Tax=Hyalella azteca TaxID=294128 RepID=A0A8B7PPA9_HYAAZ|nr:protein unc-13 homolog 4B [Hyalella azteca]